MPNAKGKTIDNTDLSVNTAEERGFLHRDYIAHCFRWTHVVRAITPLRDTARILDIGCGKDLPLPRTLYTMRIIPKDYVGVDWNHPDNLDRDFFKKAKNFPLHAYGHIDFANDVETVGDTLIINTGSGTAMHALPNVFVCFEMLEHVEPAHTLKTVRLIHKLMSVSETYHGKGTTVAFISTPCYDEHVGAADNHVNEMTREALGGLFEDVGFYIAGNWGTFASQKDYKKLLLKERPELEKLWDQLHGYYDSNVLSTIFAPIVPQYSRNNLWMLTINKLSEVFKRKFPPLIEAKQPWSSSKRWEELSAEEVHSGVHQTGSTEP